MVKPKTTSPFGAALKRARRHLDLDQAALARRLLVSRRSIVRWEQGWCLPVPAERADVLQRLGDVPYELLAPIAQTLALALDPLAHVGGAAGAKRALDERLYAVAESADVSARRLREAVVAVLDAASALGLTMEQSRAMLAPASPGASRGR